MVCVDGYSKPNPADRAQVIKRIHRIGQTQPVLIEDLCIQGTLDEVLRKHIHPSRTRIAKQILGKSALNIKTSIKTRTPPGARTHRQQPTTAVAAMTTGLAELRGIGGLLGVMWEAWWED